MMIAGGINGKKILANIQNVLAVGKFGQFGHECPNNRKEESLNGGKKSKKHVLVSDVVS